MTDEQTADETTGETDPTDETAIGAGAEAPVEPAPPTPPPGLPVRPTATRQLIVLTDGTKVEIRPESNVSVLEMHRIGQILINTAEKLGG